MSYFTFGSLGAETLRWPLISFPAANDKTLENSGRFENLQSDAGKVQISVFSQVFFSFCCDHFWKENDGWYGFCSALSLRWLYTPLDTQVCHTGCGCRRCQHVMSSCSCAFVNTILLFFAGLPCGGDLLSVRLILIATLNLLWPLSSICPG